MTIIKIGKSVVELIYTLSWQYTLYVFGIYFEAHKLSQAS